MRVEHGGEGGAVNELGLSVKIGGELCPKHPRLRLLRKAPVNINYFHCVLGVNISQCFC